MRWAWILVASIALAQTAASPPPTPPLPRDALRAAVEKQLAAVAAQREAVRKQADTAGVWLAPWSAAEDIAEAPCEPIADAAVAPIIDGAAKSQDVQARLLRAVVEQESAFRPCAISSKGAKGLMQLMPATIEQLGVSDPFDPKENVEAGARFLKQLIDKYKGDLKLALGAYNAGPATVDQSGGVPDIPETRDYVDAILKKLGATPPAPPQSPTPKPIGN